jgi:hypothetical protein
VKKLDIELKFSAKKHRRVFTQVINYINSLPVDGSYKALFLDAYRSRGWKNIIPYRSELTDIGQNGCDVTKMFLESKLCGLTTLHDIVMYADKKRRAEVYQIIKNKGVKASREEVQKYLKMKPSPKLDLE